MRRAISFLALLAFAGCAFPEPPSETFNLHLSGRTEVPVSHVVRVTYLARNRTWFCTRYSWGARRRVPKARTRDYEVNRDDRSWSLILPILSWGPDDHCGWEADFVAVRTGSWYVGVATVDPEAGVAFPIETKLICRLGESSEKWLCVDPAPHHRNRESAGSRVRVDLLRN